MDTDADDVCVVRLECWLIPCRLLLLLVVPFPLLCYSVACCACCCACLEVIQILDAIQSLEALASSNAAQKSVCVESAAAGATLRSLHLRRTTEPSIAIAGQKAAASATEHGGERHAHILANGKRALLPELTASST